MYNDNIHVCCTHSEGRDHVLPSTCSVCFGLSRSGLYMGFGNLRQHVQIHVEGGAHVCTMKTRNVEGCTCTCVCVQAMLKPPRQLSWLGLNPAYKSHSIST